MSRRQRASLAIAILVIGMVALIVSFAILPMPWWAHLLIVGVPVGVGLRIVMEPNGDNHQ